MIKPQYFVGEGVTEKKLCIFMLTNRIRISWQPYKIGANHPQLGFLPMTQSLRVPMNKCTIASAMEIRGLVGTIRG